MWKEVQEMLRNERGRLQSLYIESERTLPKSLTVTCWGWGGEGSWTKGDFCFLYYFKGFLFVHNFSCIFFSQMLFEFYLTGGQRKGAGTIQIQRRGCGSPGSSIVNPRKGLCLDLEVPRSLGEGVYLRMSPQKMETASQTPTCP